ncbi:MAG: hypothetical protein GAK30_03477 [Paracidovorax wautersii]|uniref:DUF4148 domain-containing protein n=1 Tax=Paracidovorax wautersii TaxID=1177982 RepID=A0A7V8FL30_9BURK|nr:MAG: hypothetical protein GAK30_03477 [Paracidovorax wautersii]
MTSRTLLLFVSAMAAASAALAAPTAESAPPYPTVTGTPVSRAQVVADLNQQLQQQRGRPARAEGYQPATTVAADTKTPRSRSAVVAELRDWQQAQSGGPVRAE